MVLARTMLELTVHVKELRRDSRGPAKYLISSLASFSKHDADARRLAQKLGIVRPGELFKPFVVDVARELLGEESKPLASGPSLEELCKRHDMEALYVVLYRLGSQSTHGLDALRHSHLPAGDPAGRPVGLQYAAMLFTGHLLAECMRSIADAAGEELPIRVVRTAARLACLSKEVWEVVISGGPPEVRQPRATGTQGD
jgi:hypothetical protein